MKIRASFTSEEVELLIAGLNECLHHDLNSIEYGKDESEDDEAEVHRRYSRLIHYLSQKIAKEQEPTE